MQDWTTPTDLADQVLRAWAKGRILRARMTGEPLFPLILKLRRPDTSAYSAHFEKVRNWIRVLEEGARKRRGFGYDIEWRSQPARDRWQPPSAGCARPPRDGVRSSNVGASP